MSEYSSADTDLSGPKPFDQGIPHDVFAEMRNQPGLTWNATGDTDGGFWSVARFADVAAISRDTETYSSAVGHIQIYNIDEDALEARASMIDMDPPEHTRLRKLVSRAFLPTTLQANLPALYERVRAHVQKVVAEGGGQWVSEVSKPVPIGIICDMLGVPPEDHELMIELTDHLVAGTSDKPLDPGAYGNTTPLRLLPFNSPAAHALREYAVRLGRERRAAPQDDLVSLLVDVEVDGERLSEDEFANFFRLLIFAGNETTRTAISHLAMQASQFPESFARLYRQPEHMDSAAEEVVRYASPILYFRRTATRDVTLADTTVCKGQRVVMWYASANFDEARFAMPFSFDIARRRPRGHAGFGGGGAHLCLGAWLARMELRAILETLAESGARLHAGTPEYVSSNFVNGVERLDVEFV